MRRKANSRSDATSVIALSVSPISTALGVCLATVVEVAVELRRARALVATAESRGFLPCQPHVPGDVPRAQVGALPALRESLEPELAQGLEHPVPRLVEIDELHHGLVDEVREQVGHVVGVAAHGADVLRGGEVEPADERGERGEQLLLGSGQEPVRPFEGVAEGPVPAVGAAL